MKHFVKKPPIQLTPAEQAVFKLLREAGERHGLVLRAAGGWVRDKLLGKDSHDIDIAIDRVTGAYFVREVLGLPAHVMTARPEQSKHLETASARIEGLSIDFANLRDESGGTSYENADNRILTHNTFGTPEVDASRRDFTVNGLFFNLMTGEVEDYVGGLADLGFVELEFGYWERQYEGVVLDTPLDPVQTFSDDPLRLLRGLRFMSKLNATLAQRVEDAMGHPQVLERFRTRLTQERIATELLGQRELDGGFKSGILNGHKGLKAMAKLEAAGLLDIIFDVPLIRGWKPFRMDQKSKYHSFDVWTHTVCTVSLLLDEPFVRDLSVSNPERYSWLVFACWLHDIGKRDPKKCQQKDDGTCSYVGHEESSAEAARDICNKLRLSNEATEYIVKVVAHHMDPHGREWGDRDATLRRYMNRLPDCWEDIIVHARADCYGSGSPRPPEELARYGEKIERCKWLLENDPVQATNQKPALDGRIIVALMPELGYQPVNRYLPPRPRRGGEDAATAEPAETKAGSASHWLDRILKR